MGEEEVTITFDLNSEKISIKINPALYDAIEQDMKLYGLTHEEVLCTGLRNIFSNYPLDELINMDFNELITLPLKNTSKKCQYLSLFNLNQKTAKS
jgi:hypothetical protein